jgi:hypothetical protein
MTTRCLGYITNRVLVFLVVSSCSISVIEAIFFFSTQDRVLIKLRFSSIIYILSLSILSYTFQSLIKYISIRSLILFRIIFLIRVIKNTTNILTLPMTGPTFLLDKLLEPVKIKWFYRPLPINESGPFFFN